MGCLVCLGLSGSLGGGGASEEDFFIRKCNISWITGGVTQEVLSWVTS